MNARIALLCCALTILAAIPAVHAQGRLQSVREQVRERDEDPPEEKADHDHSCHDDDDEDGTFFGDVCAGAIYLLFAEFDEPYCYLRFPRHPYQNGYPAYMIFDPIEWAQDVPEWSKKSPPRYWAGRFSLENGDNFTDLNRSNGELFLETCSWVGILTRWNFFRERLPVGGDELLFGDAILTWRISQSQHVLSRIGVGMTVLDDRYGTDLGMTFHYGVDAFPVKPIVCSGALEAGFIGEASFVHGRATVGVTRNGWELFTGYDYLNIGSIRLQGPLVGLRFWF